MKILKSDVGQIFWGITIPSLACYPLWSLALLRMDWSVLLSCPSRAKTTRQNNPILWAVLRQQKSNEYMSNVEAFSLTDCRARSECRFGWLGNSVFTNPFLSFLSVFFHRRCFASHIHGGGTSSFHRITGMQIPTLRKEVAAPGC